MTAPPPLPLPDDPRRAWALAEARRMLAEGYLYPGDYVMLMDDPESGDEGEQIAHVDADGNLVEHAK